MKGKIRDERRDRAIEPKEARGGMMYVPRYAVAKYALSLVVNGRGSAKGVKDRKLQTGRKNA